MYFADTHRDTVWAYDYDVHTGEATNERVFLDFGPLPAGRTGRAIDEAGCYWIACVTGAMVIRVTPDGAVDRRIACRSRSRRCRIRRPGSRDPVHHDDRGGGSHAVDPSQALAGGLFAVDVGVRGMPETPFEGGPPVATP